jgi:hypothetical protein
MIYVTCWERFFKKYNSMDSALELVGVMTRLDTNNEKDIPI